jgi:hypothetical protein
MRGASIPIRWQAHSVGRNRAVDCADICGPPVARVKFVAPVTRARAWRGMYPTQTRGPTCCVLESWADSLTRIMLPSRDHSNVAQATITGFRPGATPCSRPHGPPVNGSLFDPHPPAGGLCHPRQPKTLSLISPPLSLVGGRRRMTQKRNVIRVHSEKTPEAPESSLSRPYVAVGCISATRSATRRAR